MGIVMEKIVVAGPVIVEKGRVLLIRDEEEFYKFPGGGVETGETKEDACKREVLEEINGTISIIRKLSTMYLDKNPKTGEAMRIELHHYLATLNNPQGIRPLFPVQEIAWLDITDIRRGVYEVAPNVKYLIKKGQIR